MRTYAVMRTSHMHEPAHARVHVYVCRVCRTRVYVYAVSTCVYDHIHVLVLVYVKVFNVKTLVVA